MKNDLEREIQNKLKENNGVYTEEIYLMTFDLMKEDDDKACKAKRLINEKALLNKIQIIFGRECPTPDEEPTLVNWLKYLLED